MGKTKQGTLLFYQLKVIKQIFIRIFAKQNHRPITN